MMIKTSLLSLVILLSGLVFAHRIQQKIKTQKVFSNAFMTKIGTFYFSLFIFIFIHTFHSPFLLWMTLFTLFTVIPISLFLLNKIHQQHFHGEFLRFLSVVTMKMQTGYSFRSSFVHSRQVFPWKYDHIYGSILDNVVFSQQENRAATGPWGGILGRIQNEMVAIDQHQHQAIDRLCKFRKNFQDQLFFRRKSRQIWLYFAYQLGLLSIIYWPLMIYVATHYEISAIKNVLLLSLVLYLLGVFVVIYISQRQQWHI
jgi:hypothetical protein